MSLKLKILALILLCTLPIVLFVIVVTYNQFRAAQTTKLVELETLTTLIASEHKQVTEGSRQLLITLATTPVLKTPGSPNCSTFLSSLRSQYIRYTNFGVINSRGQILCAADLKLALANPPNPELITQTLKSQNFTLGTYYKIKNNGAVINFAYPLSSSQIVYASLSLDWVSDFISTLPTPPSLVINILDQHGIVLARRPEIAEALGKSFATDELIQQILTQDHGTTVKTGLDNVTRLYAFTSLGEDQKTYVAAGLPQSLIFAGIRSALITSFITLALITIISCGIALKVGNLLIVKQVESLESIDRLKDEFVSLASHQLRSPMTAIRWLAESLLESKENLSKSERTALKKIHLTTLRLIHLTSSLLNISRLETGSLTPHPQLITLKSVIAPIIAELSPAAKHAHVHLLTRYSPSLQLSTDPHLLHEVLCILLGNGIKYSPRGSSVVLSARHTLSSLIIQVSDHGIGIPKADLSHLFTRFYRADNAKLHSPDGNGLGLYLAKLITNKLGGSLKVHSTPQKSTVFTLTLPNEVS